MGLVASFNRPGGNITGVSWQGYILVAKQFQLLHEVVPKRGLFGLLLNPTNGVDREAEVSAVRAAADTFGRKLLVVRAATEADLEQAFAMLAENDAVGVSIVPDRFLFDRRSTIVALAARYGCRNCAGFRAPVTQDFPRAGCGRRLKSAKARSRVVLGTAWQRALWGFEVSAGVDRWRDASATRRACRCSGGWGSGLDTSKALGAHQGTHRTP